MITEYLNLSFRSIGYVLANRVNMGVQTGALSFKQTNEPLGDITSMIGIIDDHMHLSLAISFNEATALSISGDYSQQVHYHIDDSVIDVVKIITTMIGNDLKHRLQNLGFTPILQHPTVIHGFDRKIFHPFEEAVIVLPTNTELGIVFSEVSVQMFSDYRQAS